MAEGNASEGNQTSRIGEWNVSKIARVLSDEFGIRIPRDTVYAWLKKGTLSFQEYDRIRKRNLG
jgi:transposase